MSPRHMMLAAAVALLYAACYASIKIGLAYAPPFRFAALRTLIGGTTLLVFLALSGQRLLPARRLWLPIALLALVGPIVGFGAMFNSPLHTGAGLSSVLGNIGPLLVIVMAAVFLGEPMTPGKLAALAGGLLGVATLAWSRSGPGAPVHVAAIALPLVAAASGAGESILVKLARPAADVTRVAVWQFLLASPTLFALSGWLEAQQSIVWTTSFMLVLVFLAGGATAAATALWYWLVQREDVSRISLLLFLVPVGGLGLAAALFGERINTVQAAGIVLIFAGLVAAAFERSGCERNASFSGAPTSIGRCRQQPLTRVRLTRDSVCLQEASATFSAEETCENLL
jgi:drug/metabolite transporter (DMT)-like permease